MQVFFLYHPVLFARAISAVKESKEKAECRCTEISLYLWRTDIDLATSNTGWMQRWWVDAREKRKRTRKKKEKIKEVHLVITERYVQQSSV